MSAIRAQDDGVRAFGMMREDRLPFVGDQNWAAPPVSDFYLFQHGMEAVHSALEIFHETGSFAGVYVEVQQFAPVADVDQAAAEDDSVVLPQASPKIGQVDRVERF